MRWQRVADTRSVNANDTGRGRLCGEGAPRSLARDYGPVLRALFLARIDQIHFKVLAAADPKAPERHLEDLMLRLRPTTIETRMAVAWLLDRQTTSWMRGNVRHVVEVLGHADIARDIPQ